MPPAVLAAAYLPLRMKRWLVSLSVGLGALLLALVAGEVVVRAVAPIHSWRLPWWFLIQDGKRVRVHASKLRKPASPLFRPGIVYDTCFDMRWGAGRPYMGEDGCVRTEINSQGWRGPEVPFERDPEALRLIAVGDSLTYGEAVPYEMVWPTTLARLVEEAMHAAGDARRVEVVNIAVPAVNLPHLRPMVEAFVPPYHADLVVYGFFLNDAWLPGTNVKKSIGTARRVQRIVTGDPSGMAHSVLWRRFLLWKAQTAQREAYPHLQVFDPQSENWRRCAEHLRAMRDAVEGSGARFLVAILPDARPEPDVYLFTQVHEWLHEFFDGERIPWVDVLDGPWYPPEELRVHPTDIHPNELGHRLIAETVLPEALHQLRAAGDIQFGQ